MLRLRTSIGCVAAALCSLALAAPALADDFVVNDFGSGLDNGPGDGECDADAMVGAPFVCTLRAAVNEGNMNGAALDTVTFSVTGTHALGSLIATPMTITGNGSGQGGTVIDGGDAGQILNATAAVTLNNMRFQNGRRTLAGFGGGGGAIEGNAALTLNNVTVTGNDVDGDPGLGGVGTGGGIYNGSSASTVKINNSTVSGNTVNVPTGLNGGGGVFVTGSLIIENSTVSGNSILTGATGDGGGIYVGVDFQVTNTTVSGNSIVPGGSFGGGGVFALGNAPVVTREIVNSTISGNTAAGEGGGGLLARGSVSITNATFAGNGTSGAGADLRADNGTTTIKNTILGSAGACAVNPGPPGVIMSAVPGHNIDNGTSCGFGVADGNKQGTSPLLAPLGAYGGPTLTHALLIGSPAVDMASADCGGLGSDQRGVARPLGTVCDIGAFEGTVDLSSPSTGAGPTTPAATPPRKTCPKKKRLKRGKCVKKKRKKKK